MEVVTVTEGCSPLILAMPHTGTFVPCAIRETLSDTGLALEDTDWHVHRLYDGLLPDATIIRANFHRYVIDANRDPSGASLYPGHNTTGLCPVIDFEGVSLYKAGHAPDASDIDARRQTFHAPYHVALEAQIKRVKNIYGLAVLYDCHSIQSQKPYLFKGVLPDFNIGTNDGQTCGAEFESAVRAICQSAEDFTFVTNGRFKGGWTTRQYGQPRSGVHAIQMELAQSTYMSEIAPWTYNPEKAALIRPHLQAILTTLDNLAKEVSHDR